MGRAGFSPGQRVFGRRLRLPSSLQEDDFIDPYTIVQDANHEMRRSETMRMAAAHGCVVAADRRAMTTAAYNRRRKPQRGLVAEEPVITHRRKDGAQGWCGPGVCVLSEEPKPGRNETVWVHMRNCLHKCNRTLARPATNEEAEGIETVASLLRAFQIRKPVLAMFLIFRTSSRSDDSAHGDGRADCGGQRDLGPV